MGINAIPKATFEPVVFARQLLLLAFGMMTAFALTESLAIGQPGNSVGAARRTEILFLGTAGGPPLRLNRSEPAALLIVDGRAYLIDCGIGTMQRLQRTNIQSETIKTIFFTHLHSDHDLGLADVMANDFFRLSNAHSADLINIYGPPQTKELVDAAFHYIAVSVRPFAAQDSSRYRMVKGEFANPFVTHEIDHEGVIFQDDKIRVTAAENAHYVLIPTGVRSGLRSYSYRIETPHGAVVFTGDTGPSDAVARLAKDADVLVAEATYRDPSDLDRRGTRSNTMRAQFQFEHLNSHSVGELASKAQVKSVLLYHYNPADKADEVAYVSGVKTFYHGPVFAPSDLDSYCLGSAEESQSAPILALCSGNSP